MKNWLKNSQDEALMEESHCPMWQIFIDNLEHDDFSGARVLDFGCNRGGFLRLLYSRMPFAYGLGIDLVEEPIAIATQNKRDLPLEYVVASSYERWQGSFDRALSYEVLYLLPDLQQHARSLYALLKPGGIYYACTGCHTENPLWPA